MAVVSLAGYKPSERFDGKWWTEARIEGAASDVGPWADLETITLDPVEPDPTDPLERNFTTEEVTSETWVRVVFVDLDGDEETTLPVPLLPTAFATRADVAARLGRELTDDEEAQVDYLLRVASALVAQAAGKDITYTPVPELWRWVTAEVAARGFLSPVGVSATREQLGEYSYSQSFQSGEYGGLWLSPAEERMLRGALWGTSVGSARLDSIAFDAEPWN